MCCFLIVDPVRRLTAAGTELVHEGERLLAELDTVAQRIRRVATGWEAVLNIAVDSIITEATILDLIAEFLAQRPPTRIKLQRETLSGTWEALVSGRADLAIGVADQPAPPAGIQSAPLGEIPFVLSWRQTTHWPVLRGPLPTSC